MPFPIDDLEWAFRDSGGVQAFFGALNAWGHLDQVDGALLPEAEVVGLQITFTYAQGRLGGLTVGSELRIGSDTYTVRQAPFRKSDGTNVVLLAEAA
jgi:hypothetical protein